MMFLDMRGIFVFIQPYIQQIIQEKGRKNTHTKETQLMWNDLLSLSFRHSKLPDFKHLALTALRFPRRVTHN